MTSQEKGPRGAGTLYVVATPIGNLDDISARALRVLGEVRVIACEDTRHTGLMLKRLGVERGDRRFVAYHDAVETRQAPRLLAALLAGEDVALVTNAGTPLVSDPGFRLVAAARQAGVRVVPVPGPCAAVAALSVSGLPTDRFTFLGFVPPRPGRRLEVLRTAIAAGTGTAVLYVPARMLAKVLEELVAMAPSARVVVAREMTKVFEEFLTGSAAECLAALAGRTVKGEVTLLVNAREATSAGP